MSNHCQKAWNSNFSCLRCRKKHHTTLCFGNQNDSATQLRESQSTNTKTNTPEKELSANLVQNQVNGIQVGQVPLNVLATLFQIQNESTVMTIVLCETNWWNSPIALLSTIAVYIWCVQEEFAAAYSIIDCGSMCNLITNELDFLNPPPQKKRSKLVLKELLLN